MKKAAILLLFLLCWGSQGLFAQETPGLNVDEMQFCTAVEERQPVGADTAFANTVENVYCYTEISGAADTTKIAHVWYYGDEEKARVDLAVKTDRWRTWSSKRILNEWSGTWRVEVVAENGSVLRSEEFTIREAMQ